MTKIQSHEQKNRVINIRIDQTTYELLVEQSVKKSKKEKRVVHLSEVVRDIINAKIK